MQAYRPHKNVDIMKKVKIKDTYSRFYKTKIISAETTDLSFLDLIPRQLSDLDFADGVVRLEEARQRLRLLFDATDEKVRKAGIKVNKTKSIAASDSLLTLTCKDIGIEQVNEFKFFRSRIDYNGEYPTISRGG
ncbi:hypothetical protein QYM36_015188 [Artemia franciscana]|uniref:Uncharacterized protein n=1 Tax=Artemia franciscana TaxID=6661 RepID=A0AA88HE61_ARTSF|nr:hypothetical protein QYM36_015188 [Artemia franciscana]